MMTKGMRVTGKRITDACDPSRKKRKRSGRRAVRRAIKLDARST